MIWTRLNDAARVDHDNSIGDAHRFDLIMRHINQRHVEFLDEPLQLHTRLRPKLGVQIGERLIEEQQLQVAGEGAGDGHALLFAAGEMAWKSAHQAFNIDPRDLGHSIDMRRHFFLPIAQPQKETDRLAAFPMRDQHIILKDHANAAVFNRYLVKRYIVVENFSAVGLVQARNQSQQRGLAAAAGSQQDHRLAIFNMQIKILDRQNRRELAALVIKRLAHILQRNRSHSIAHAIGNCLIA